MTYTMTVTTETEAGTTVEPYTVAEADLAAKREELRRAAPHGATRTITVE